MPRNAVTATEADVCLRRCRESGEEATIRETATTRMKPAATSWRRRTLLPTVLLLLTIVIVAGGGCDGGTPDVGQSGETATRRAGALRVGIDPITNLDPHFATTFSDILLATQVYDRLIDTDAQMRPQPALATSWASEDARVWSFELRDDVVFHNGEPFSAEDVVYSIERLRDPEIGSPLVGLFSSVESVEADGEHAVVFTLTTPDAEFPAELSDHHAVILSHSVDDPKSEWVGTGPFVLEDGITQKGVTLRRFEEYWRTGDGGEQLPYLDELSFVVTAGAAARLEALQRGRLDVVGELDPAQAETVAASGRLRLLTAPSNAFWALHIRCDDGAPGEDPDLRRALAAATDGAAIAASVRGELAEPGNGTCVGPAYGPDYLDQAPAVDLDEARRLLAAAGGDGLTVELTVPDEGDAPAVAAAWKEQMAAVDVTVDVDLVPATEYFGDGPGNWLEVDFGLTDWGTRSTPLTYFELAYAGGAPFNQSHWADAAFDELVNEIAATVDDAERAGLYHQAQTILREQVPAIVPYMEVTAAGVDAGVTGIELQPIWARTRFDTARFAE